VDLKSKGAATGGVPSRFALILVADCAVLVGSLALAQADKDLPPNTIDCTAFKKMPSGNWYVGPRTTFDVGRLKAIGLENYLVIPNDTNGSFRGVDLYGILERKCGGPRP
jgi:hypothetical protein